MILGMMESIGFYSIPKKKLKNLSDRIPFF